MTQGPIMKLVFLFALPITVGNILQQLYNTVDTLVVGNFCGSESLAAVGTSGLPIEILLCVFLGLGTGVSILVSQAVGSGNQPRLKKVIATATAFLYMCAIPLSIIGFILTPLLLKWMQVPPEAFDLSVSYTRIVFLATLGNMGYNMNAGILRGMGDSRSSLFFLLISCILNIVLDLIFVALIHMDVSGVALATAIAMYVSWISSIVYIKRKFPDIEYSARPRIPDISVLSDIVKIGLPLGLNQSIYSVGHVMMQTLVNAQGYAFMAGWSVGSKIPSIANVAISSFSSAATTFAGQNLGAGNYARLKKGSLRIPFCSGLITLISGITLTIFCKPVLRLFTQDPDVLYFAVRYIYVLLPFTWCYAIFNGINCYANGIGEVKYTTFVNIVILWVVRIPSAYLIAHFIDGTWVMAAVPLSFFFGLAGMLFFYRSERWKAILRKAEEQEKALAN